MQTQNMRIYRKCHQLPMNKNNTTQVNPIPADYLDYCQIGKGPNAGCVDFVFKSTPEEGGALFSPQVDPDILPDHLFFGFNRRVKFLMPDELGRDEFDVKWTLAGGLQMNLSNQINWSEGGMWQTDPNDPPKWEDTGFNVAPLLTSGFNDFMFRCSTDGKVWNIDALACNGTAFTALPANNRGIPLKQTNWTSLKAHMQNQVEVRNTPAYTVVRYQDAQILTSDEPIGLGWF